MGISHGTKVSQPFSTQASPQPSSSASEERLWGPSGRRGASFAGPHSWGWYCQWCRERFCSHFQQHPQFCWSASVCHRVSGRAEPRCVGPRTRRSGVGRNSRSPGPAAGPAGATARPIPVSEDTGRVFRKVENVNVDMTKPQLIKHYVGMCSRFALFSITIQLFMRHS